MATRVRRSKCTLALSRGPACNGGAIAEGVFKGWAWWSFLFDYSPCWFTSLMPLLFHDLVHLGYHFKVLCVFAVFVDFVMDPTIKVYAPTSPTPPHIFALFSLPLPPSSSSFEGFTPDPTPPRDSGWWEHQLRLQPPLRYQGEGGGTSVWIGTSSPLLTPLASFSLSSVLPPRPPSLLGLVRQSRPCYSLAYGRFQRSQSGLHIRLDMDFMPFLRENCVERQPRPPHTTITIDTNNITSLRKHMVDVISLSSDVIFVQEHAVTPAAKNSLSRDLNEVG